MKVLHILNTRKLSGAENVAIEIISAFKDEVEMAYMSLEGEIRNSLAERSVKYFPVNHLSKNELSKWINEYKPDIIHAHDIRATIQAVRSANGTPVISHIHGNHDDMKKVSIKSLLYLLYSLRVKSIIAVSKSVVEDYAFSKVIRPNCRVIYNTMNKDRIIEKSQSENHEYHFDFVFLGRLAYPKDPLRVAEVATKVLKQIPNVKFGIIGDGDQKKLMEDFFIAEGVMDRVVFCGYLKNPYKALGQAKAMIMCSEYEGTPMAALESLILGKPIISTPVDGLKDIIVNGENGYISTNNDELAQYVCNVITNDRLRAKLQNGARKTAEEYSDINKYKAELMNIYTKVLNK
jgi:glycosyltransferase involved in cell wall biosynthesis